MRNCAHGQPKHSTQFEAHEFAEHKRVETGRRQRWFDDDKLKDRHRELADAPGRYRQPQGKSGSSEGYFLSTSVLLRNGDGCCASRIVVAAAPLNGRLGVIVLRIHMIVDMRSSNNMWINCRSPSKTFVRSISAVIDDPTFVRSAPCRQFGRVN